MKSSLALIALLSIGLIMGCKKDPVTYTQSFTPSEDGFISKSSGISYSVEDFALGAADKHELRIGWNTDGHPMRAFLTFDISAINDNINGIYEFDQVVLKVYESNTNLLPFTGDNGQRTVDIDFVNYTNLEPTAYDRPAMVEAGTIASNGFNVLAEYSLDVTTEFINYFSIRNYPQLINTEPLLIQFRLQFSDDEVVIDPLTSELAGAMWNIFSMEDPLEGGAYVPVLEVTYTVTE